MQDRTQRETPDYDALERPELASGWEWTSGETGGGYYTFRFQTECRQGGYLVVLDDTIGGYNGEVYWDKGGLHTVVLRPIVGISEDGDPEYGYDMLHGNYDTMQEAVDAVPGKIEELKTKAATKRGHA